MAGTSKFGGIGRALQNRNYRIYWAGGFFSVLGFWVQRMALGWLTWELTSSPAWLGAVGFAALAPALLLAPFAGAVADRHGLRRTATAALILSSVVSAILAVMAFGGSLTIEILFGLALMLGTAMAFDLPARQALVPFLVSRENLSSAIALNTTTFHAGGFIGPALFSGISAFFGTPWAFVINILSNIAFITALWSLRLQKRPVRENKSSILSDMVEGVRYTISHPGLQALFVMAMIPHLLIRPYIDLLPAFSADVFGRGADGFAIMAGISGLGSLGAGIWLALRGRTAGLARINVAGVALAALSMMAFSLSLNFFVALVCLFFVGVFMVAIGVASQSLMQNAVDPTKRGRVIGLSTGMAIGLPAIGSLSLGSLGSIYGIQAPVIGAMVLGLICLAWAAPRVLRQTDKLEKVRDNADATNA